jgi:uncharacterized membrane protein YdbT with pleckstrin-like domain
VTETPHSGGAPAYVDARLLPGERVIHRSFLAVQPLLGLPGLFVFLVLVTLFIFLPLALMFLVVILVATVIQRLRFQNTEFALTDRRILIKVGWLSHRSSEVLLNKVESIHVQQDLLGRKFNYGNIVVTGTGGSREVLAEIEKPFDFYRLLQEQLVAAKAGGRTG